MDVHLASAITQTLQDALSRADAGYPASSDGVSTAFCDFARERWDWDIEAADVSIHVDAGQPSPAG